MMKQKKLDFNYISNELNKIWNEDPINSLKTLLRNLDNECIEFDTPTQKLINKSFLSIIKDQDNISLTGEIEKNEEDEREELKSGKEKNKDNDNDTSQELEKSSLKVEKEKEEIRILFTKDVLHYVIPLTCILTMKNSNKEFVKMLNDIKENRELSEMFNDMLMIWWNKKDLIHIITEIVNKSFEKNINIYNISFKIKMEIQSLIDKPKELIELINECLKPKDIEKKKFGEVFTPLDFINNKMLFDLETYYKEKYNKNIYEDETLKWGDTTAGMGNFPIAIYYKLMDGLKLKIIDEKERKKHILEKMLFMAEFNKKNCFIIKQIFNISNEFNINLYEGDSLKLDIKKEFGIDKFDIVIGNPPYNEEFKGKNGYAPALYNKFTEFYIDKCSIICYIIPSRWFSGGRGLDGFRK